MINRSQAFVLASAVCFYVALLVALGVVSSNEDAWLAGGALAYVLAAL